MTPVAPCVANNNFSSVTDINHEGHVFGDLGASLFLWPAQHLVVLDRQFVAGAAFGDVGVLLSVAGAAFGDVRVSLFLENASPKREK